MKEYSVNFFGSHPDSENDDCWNGEDFDTLAEAELAFAAGSDDISTTHVELYGPGVNRVRKLRDAPATSGNWRREIAREAGMLGGCDAYNEVMGY